MIELLFLILTIDQTHIEEYGNPTIKEAGQPVGIDDWESIFEKFSKGQTPKDYYKKGSQVEQEKADSPFPLKEMIDRDLASHMKCFGSSQDESETMINNLCNVDVQGWTEDLGISGGVQKGFISSNLNTIDGFLKYDTKEFFDAVCESSGIMNSARTVRSQQGLHRRRQQIRQTARMHYKNSYTLPKGTVTRGRCSAHDADGQFFSCLVSDRYDQIFYMTCIPSTILWAHGTLGEVVIQNLENINDDTAGGQDGEYGRVVSYKTILNQIHCANFIQAWARCLEVDRCWDTATEETENTENEAEGYNYFPIHDVISGENNRALNFKKESIYVLQNPHWLVDKLCGGVEWRKQDWWVSKFANSDSHNNLL